MTPDSVGPFARPVHIERLPALGDSIEVEANAEERAALAKDFNIPAIHALIGRFDVSGNARRLKVAGRIEASIRQTCIVSLEEFDSRFEEDVEVEFAAPDLATPPEGNQDAAIERPDAIVDGRIDLGALVAEFVALGLDPYPRKPGVAFSPADAGQEDDRPSPFAALAALKDRT